MQIILQEMKPFFKPIKKNIISFFQDEYDLAVLRGLIRFRHSCQNQPQIDRTKTLQSLCVSVKHPHTHPSYTSTLTDVSSLWRERNALLSTLSTQYHLTGKHFTFLKESEGHLVHTHKAFREEKKKKCSRYTTDVILNN